MSNILQKAKRNATGVAAFAFAAAVILPNVIVGHAAAAQLTTRRIEMSNATIGTQTEGQGVTYKLVFRPATTDDIRSVVIDFCQQSPLIGSATCSLPAGMTVGTSSPTGTSGSWTASRINANRTLVLTASADVNMPNTADFELEVGGFTNPSSITQFFARVFTFDNSATANSYTAGTPGAHTDDGGIALSTTDDINISAAVMETLTFCVSATAPGDGCTATATPDLTLGTGTPAALSFTAVDTVDAYFQLSTNAAGNTYINMKNSATSGGLNNGSNNIDPVDSATNPATITAGTEAFGVRVDSGSGDYGTVTGTTAYASATQYNMRVPEVTSTYGDRIASATGAVANYNVPLEFAATISPTTAAGLYTANISLIASSTY